MRSKKSASELLKLASKTNVLPDEKYEEILRRLQSNDESIVNHSRRFRFFSRGRAISVAVLSVILLCAAVLYVPHVVYTATYGKVTHNSIPQELIPSVKVKGLTHPSDSHLIGQRAALKITNSMLKYYKGNSRDIELVSTSVPTGSTYERLGPSKTSGDPNFTRSNGLWKNIPCYIVVIKNPKRKMGFGAPKDGGGNTPRSTFVIALVDATNGKILNSYVTSVPKAYLLTATNAKG